jgi:hypothetical protein
LGTGLFDTSDVLSDTKLPLSLHDNSP